jgi:hypothetical protein
MRRGLSTIGACLAVKNAASRQASPWAMRDRIAALFDHFQGRMPALPMQRLFLRCFRLRLIPNDRIAQCLQFQIGNSIELYADFEDRQSHQVRGLRVSAVGETNPALLERGQNRLQSFF